MRKNVASQVIGAQLVSATDGSAFTGSATVVITVDGGTQSASGGTGPTHEGNGFHSYLPTQAETNGDHVAFTFTGSGAVPVTVQVYTSFPQTGDTFAALPTNFVDLSITASTGRVDVASIAGTAQTARDLGASVLLSPGTGTGQISLASGAVTAGTVSDKTGYSLTQSFPSNFADLAITVTTGRVTAGTVSDKTGYSLTATTGLGNQTANITGNLSGSVGSVTGHTAQTGDTFALANGAAGFVAIDTVVDAVKAVTDALPDSGALTSIAQASAVATAAELAKVPKSDGTTSWNATALAAINAEADTAISDASLATAAALATVDGIVDTLNLGIITGAAATGTLSTTQATSDLTGYADDQLIGRVIIWTSGNCDGEATDITDYASASGLLTFTALTTAPANGDTFKIV